MSEECANPLLLGWIKEWLDQARERNSKGLTVLDNLNFIENFMLTFSKVQESL
jgi:hypothetical protein